MYVPTRDAIKAVEPDSLIDVLVTLREQGFIQDFHIDSLLTEVQTNRKDQFDIFSMVNDENDELNEREPVDPKKLL